MTQYPELFNALGAKFTKERVRSKPKGKGGGTFDYITARTVMNRLDSVLGPENWWAEYAPLGDHSVVCKLTIRLPDGSLLTKSDAGGNAGMADEGDDEKSACSDALKRAAVHFGVGRYLYGDGMPRFAATTPAAAIAAAGFNPLVMPMPQGLAPARSRPRTAAELVAWIQDQEECYEIPLASKLGEWARGKDYPVRPERWTESQVAAGFVEAERIAGALVRQLELAAN